MNRRDLIKRLGFGATAVVALKAPTLGFTELPAAPTHKTHYFGETIYPDVYGNLHTIHWESDSLPDQVTVEGRGLQFFYERKHRESAVKGADVSTCREAEEG